MPAAGHTSWSTAGLGYVSIWIAGKLRIYDGSGHPWKVPLSMVPLGGAAWIGITRLQVFCVPFYLFIYLFINHCKSAARSHWP